MAFGEIETLRLHVSGREHVTADWVARTLTQINYMYNIAAVVDLIDQGYLSGSSAEFVQEALADSGEAGMVTEGRALQVIVRDGAHLTVSRIRADESWISDICGLGKVLEVLRKTFDPNARAKAREENRHTAKMNRIKEADAERDLIVKQATDALDFLIKAGKVRDELERYLGSERADEWLREAREAFARAAILPPGIEIKAIEGAHD